LSKVSIITACSPDAVQFLHDALRSIETSFLPAGWRLEWVLQEDGPVPTVDSDLLSHPAIKYQVNGSSLGTATTRNLALARANGDMLVALDADDMLADGGLLAMLRALNREPMAAWAVGNHSQLFPDGKIAMQEPLLEAGIYKPGEVVKKWVEFGRAPFRSSLACMRTGPVWRIGGWPALGRLDDAALIYALSIHYCGLVLPEYTLIYRRWSGQKTAQDWSENLKDISRAFTLRWLEAMGSDFDC